MSAGVLATVIAACTPTQQIEISDQSNGSGKTVFIDDSGLGSASLENLRSIIAKAGYAIAASGDVSGGTATVVFSVGEARRSETVVEFPEYEQVQEVRFINGRNRVFSEERFVGYKREHIVSTVYPSTAELRIEAEDSVEVVRKVQTEGECGNPEVLKPALIDALLTLDSTRVRKLELPGC